MKIFFFPLSLIPSILQCLRVSLVWWTPLSRSIRWGLTWQKSTAKIGPDLWRTPRSTQRKTVKSDLSTDDTTLTLTAIGFTILFVCFKDPHHHRLKKKTMRCPVLMFLNCFSTQPLCNGGLCSACQKKQDFLVNGQALACRCHLWFVLTSVYWYPFRKNKYNQRSNVQNIKKKKVLFCSPQYFLRLIISLCRPVYRFLNFIFKC